MAVTMSAPMLYICKLKYFILRHKIFSIMTTVSILIGIKGVSWRQSLYSDTNVDGWIKTAYFGCDFNFVGYGKKFAVLRHAHLDIKTRTFSIPCVGYKPYYRFSEGPGGNVLNEWMKNMTIYNHSFSEDITTTAIAVYRKQAHNLYRSMCDWYNLYLVCSLLNLGPKQVTILFLDDRPPSLLEDVWYQLFGDVDRYQYIPTENVYQTLIWNINGYQSPMNNPKISSLPYVQEFRKFILNSYGIYAPKKLNCQLLNVTIIYRRDYVSHPEKTDDLVSKKFDDDSKVWSVVKEVFEEHKVTGLPLEHFSMKQQLKYISNTDILIGMHGSGLSHILFLPPHAACFEIFPNYVENNDRYKILAKWRGIKYIRWKNTDPINELPGHKTRIPDNVLIQNLKMLKAQLCKSS